MPEFKLGQCSVNLQLERLAGPLSENDRQVAWRIFLALSTCPELRHPEPSTEYVRALVGTLASRIECWPAGQVECLRPGHLGPLVCAVVELVLMPCLAERTVSVVQWNAVRVFCARLAQEVARHYDFPDPVANIPHDLRAAWCDNT